MNGSGTDEGPIRARWLTPEAAQREIESFQRRFGPKALFLACHAALPQLLSPDLLHLLRLNFVEKWDIPVIAEADLLLSSLCRPLDEPLYEMEPRVREILLEHLPLDFGPDRPLKVAEFLLRWLEKTPESSRIPKETDANTWVYNAWLRPEKTVDELAAHFEAEYGEDHRLSILKLAILAETLAVPFSAHKKAKAKHQRLLKLSRRFATEVYHPVAAKPLKTGTFDASYRSEPQLGKIHKIHLGENQNPMRFVYIPPGEFMMGSPKDEPERWDDEKQHRVILTQGFYMQETPVTQAQWEAVMGENPSDFKDCGPDCPVENVSWFDARKFIKKLNASGGEYEYRLPTEAQWEYACRAGTPTPFWTGKCLNTDQANYDGNYPLKGCPKGEYRKKTTPVKTFAPNPWGLYDMHGNVLEWCSDWFDDYPDGPVTDPVGPSDGAFRVVRGGSWSLDAGGCRSADRGRGTPVNRFDVLGFRVLAVRRSR